MLEMVKKWVPFAYDAFVAYRQNATQLSGKSRDVINRKLRGEDVTLENSGLTKREWNELIAEFDI